MNTANMNILNLKKPSYEAIELPKKIAAIDSGKVLGRMADNHITKADFILINNDYWIKANINRILQQKDLY